MARGSISQPARPSGWVTFAGIILTLAGVLDILNGAWALGAQDTAIDALFFDNDLEAWGWLFIVAGAVIAATGIGVLAGASWAVVAGVVIALLGAIINMFWIFTYPIVSLVFVTLYVLAIWALVVYAGEPEQEQPPL